MLLFFNLHVRRKETNGKDLGTHGAPTTACCIKNHS